MIQVVIISAVIILFVFLADVLYDKYVGHSYFSPVRYIIKYILYYN